MCGPSRTKRKGQNVGGTLDSLGGAPQTHCKSLLQRAFLAVYPMNPWMVVALFPFVPYNWYLNRGFTVWFHILAGKSIS
jgi:methionine aminopeptidase